MNDENEYEKGKLYQWDGAKFVELEPSNEVRLPITEEAMEAVKRVRKSTQTLIKLRPELSLTASAMLLAAADMQGIEKCVQQYGYRIYSNSSLPEQHAGFPAPQ